MEKIKQEIESDKEKAKTVKNILTNIGIFFSYVYKLNQSTVDYTLLATDAVSKTLVLFTHKRITTRTITLVITFLLQVNTPSL